MPRQGELIDVIGTNPGQTLLASPDGPLKIAVELGLPATGAGILGAPFILGTSLLGGLAWYDITSRWLGCQITEGSDDDNLQVGTINVDLLNLNAVGKQDLSPWSSTFPNGAKLYAAPGTLIRVSLSINSVWAPLFTGIVETWAVVKQALNQFSTVQVTASETLSALGGNDGVGVTAGGAGESTITRCKRLLDAASWQFGFYVNGSDYTASIGGGTDTITHQDTDLSSNRLSELDLTARSHPDTTGAQVGSWRFMSDRYGHAWLGLPAPDHLTLAESASKISADSLKIATDNDLVLNVVTLGTAAGDSTTYTNQLSIAVRNGEFSAALTGFNATAGTNFDPVANELLTIGDVTTRPVQFDVDAKNCWDLHRMQPWVTIDLTTADGLIFTGYRISKIVQNLRPLGGGDLAWTATVSLRPTALSTITYPP